MRGLRSWKSERGQALVELAVALPLLLAVVFGIAEFGIILSDQINLTNATRDGARTGAISGSSASAAVDQTTSSASGLISCPLQSPSASYSGTSPKHVTVSATCTYQAVTPVGALVNLIGGGFSTPLSLQATATMRVEP